MAEHEPIRPNVPSLSKRPRKTARQLSAAKLQIETFYAGNERSPGPAGSITGSDRKLVTREIYVNGNEEQERAIVTVGVEDNHGGSGRVSRIPSSIAPSSFSPRPTCSPLARSDNQIQIRRIFSTRENLLVVRSFCAWLKDLTIRNK